MNIIEEVKKLNFLIGQYVVVGSGIMGALGLKESHDIDIVVTENLFEELRKNGKWEEVQWTYVDHPSGIFLRNGGVEVYLDVNCDEESHTADELINNAEVIDGVPFISMEQCLKFKKAYSKNNPKHFKDIETIERFLSKNSA